MQKLLTNKEMEEVLLTAAQKRKREQDAQILERWKELRANPESSTEGIYDKITKEFGCSRSRIYNLRKKNDLL